MIRQINALLTQFHLEQVGQLLTDFLVQLTTADARAAAVAAAASASASTADVTLLTPQAEFNSRRKCCIQSMVLSIAASFRYSEEELENKGISLFYYVTFMCVIFFEL